MDISDFQENTNTSIDALNKEIKERVNLDIDFSPFLRGLRLDILKEMREKEESNTLYNVANSHHKCNTSCCLT